MHLNPLSANPTKWSNTLKQFVLSVFDHFVKLALKGLKDCLVMEIIVGRKSYFFCVYIDHQAKRKKNLKSFVLI